MKKLTIKDFKYIPKNILKKVKDKIYTIQIYDVDIYPSYNSITIFNEKNMSIYEETFEIENEYTWTKIKYDKYNKILYLTLFENDVFGYWSEEIYNNNNILISKKDSNGDEHKYDSNGDILSWKNKKNSPSSGYKTIKLEQIYTEWSDNIKNDNKIIKNSTLYHAYNEAVKTNTHLLITTKNTDGYAPSFITDTFFELGQDKKWSNIYKHITFIGTDYHTIFKIKEAIKSFNIRERGK